MAVWRKAADGVILSVRVMPGARRDGIGGVYKGADGAKALKVSVRAVAEKGKANTAAIAILAKRLGFAKSSLGLVTGATSRTKQILITGAPDDVAARLVAGLNELETKRDST
jgi:uncharacterized protein (TIGR00251 family)